MQQHENQPILKYVKAFQGAFAPTKGSIRAAGYDLKSICNMIVPANGKAVIHTGLIIELPKGCYGRIAPRSGLAVHNYIDVGAGVIDEDYRGTIKVVLFNHSTEDFHITAGDRIAQLICERIYYPQLVQVNAVSSSTRKENGFGSTGV